MPAAPPEVSMAAAAPAALQPPPVLSCHIDPALAAAYAAPVAWAPAAAPEDLLQGTSDSAPRPAPPLGLESAVGEAWDFGGPRTVARVSAISRCFVAQDEFDGADAEEQPPPPQQPGSPSPHSGSSRLGPPSRVLVDDGRAGASKMPHGNPSVGVLAPPGEDSRRDGDALRQALSALPLEWLERAQAELEARVKNGGAGGA